MTGMRSRNINLVITNKVKHWLDSLPIELREQVKNDVVVTGGSIASLLLGEPVNDYDIYFKTKKSVVAICKHYIEQFLRTRGELLSAVNPIEITLRDGLTDSLGRERVRIDVRSQGVVSENEQPFAYRYFEGDASGDRVEMTQYIDAIFGEKVTQEELPSYRPKFLSSNAITLSHDVQLIIRFWGGPEQIHENFDFVHCMNYWTPGEGVVLRQDALESLMSRTLLYHGSLYPICSLIRTRKFVERGWRINAGQYLKMALQISKLDLTSFEILEEQLTGVDAAYFQELLDKARSKDDPALVETAYLTELINRMF